MSTEIVWSPLLPIQGIAALATVGVLLLVLQLLRAGRRGVLYRALLLTALLLALLEPRISVEERTPESDIAIVLVDETTSQKTGDRQARTESAVQQIVNQLSAMPGMEVRTVSVRDGDGHGTRDGTRLVGAMVDALGDLPRSRFAGAIAITDGQIHDADLAKSGGNVGPLHVLISGNKNELDRRLVIAGTIDRDPPQ